MLQWVGRPSSRGSSQPRDQTCVSCISCIGRWVLYHQHHLGSPRTLIGALKSPPSGLDLPAGLHLYGSSPPCSRCAGPWTLLQSSALSLWMFLPGLPQAVPVVAMPLFPPHHPGFKVCCLDPTCSVVFCVISHQSQQVFPLMWLSLFSLLLILCSYFFNITRHWSAHCSFDFSFDWRIIALHCCGGLCHTSVRISHDYMYVPSLFGLSPPPTPPL